jgi:glycosyltransferase involved in cell wall biosynthesis
MISAPSVELPYSFSQVNTTNQNLPYTYSDTNGSGNNFSSTSLNIPAGNYNINQLITQLTTSLIADIITHYAAFPLTAANFSISYLPQYGITTWEIIGVTGYMVTITFNFIIAYVLGLMFGFPAALTPITTTSSLNSPNKVQCNPITSVYIRSDSLRFLTNYEAIVTTYNNSDIVQKIPIISLPNAIIYYRGETRTMISNKFIATLNLYLSDNLSTSYTLDMRGVNWAIQLQIDEVQLPETNEYKDRAFSTGQLAPPKLLLDERDRLVHDLIDKKRQLEEEIENAKREIHEESNLNS